MKNKTVAILLTFFLGLFGGHKFYLGKIGMGVLYLFTGGLALIGVFIDFIVLISMSQEDFDEKYNNTGNKKSNINIAEELEKLHSLKEKNIISDEEFNKKKSQLLR
jgi:TM2 domain-containing membrane protein YozV